MNHEIVTYFLASRPPNKKKLLQEQIPFGFPFRQGEHRSPLKATPRLPLGRELPPEEKDPLVPVDVRQASGLSGLDADVASLPEFLDFSHLLGRPF